LPGNQDSWCRRHPGAIFTTRTENRALRRKVVIGLELWPDVQHDALGLLDQQIHVNGDQIDRESTGRASRWLQVGADRDGLRRTLGYRFGKKSQGALQPEGRQRQVESGRGEKRVQGGRLEPPCRAPIDQCPEQRQQADSYSKPPGQQSRRVPAAANSMPLPLLTKSISDQSADGGREDGTHEVENLFDTARPG